MTLSHTGAECSRELLLVGRVQGFGVRPAIARLAAQLELSGFVVNTPTGVAIRIQGPLVSVARFESLLLSELPQESEARIDRSDAVGPGEFDAFRIRPAADFENPPCLSVKVPADRAMCDACRRELTDAKDRRFGYGFSSCTQCGPRYSIIRRMPFERRETSLASFPRCDACEAEYTSSDDRRFHAQTIACAACGPRFWFEGELEADRRYDEEALVSAGKIIRDVGILAFRGLGGYQLICDATNDAFVRKMRRLKLRGAKPLAVMISPCDVIDHSLTAVELAALRSPANPIVIVTSSSSSNPAATTAGGTVRNSGMRTGTPARSLSSGDLTGQRAPVPVLSEAVCPGISTIGLLLPTTPLHALLLEAAGRPLVVTSGNHGSDPLEFDEQHAKAALKDIADGWLHHDRPIVRPVDDSVVRIIAGRPVTIRAARGIAPLPLAIETRDRILAVGGHQKVACAFSNGHQVILGPHLGDLSSPGARQRFVEQTRSLKELYGSDPDTIAHDLHPDYFTTRWAADQGCRTIGIQHHHAHVVTGMVEHGLLSQQVLGLAFDGTGYGPDGSVWGGEFLLASATEFRRVGHLMLFSLPGAEAAIREPWRVAVSLLFHAVPELTPQEIVELVNAEGCIPTAGPEFLFDEFCGPDALSERDRKVDRRVTAEQISGIQRLVSSAQAPHTSSMGRLFDGVASLVLGIRRCSFEGEPAMRLEAACQRCDSKSDGSWEPSSDDSFKLIHTDAGIRIDWRPFVRRLVVERRAGVSPAILATRFHHAVAAMAGSMVDEFPEYPIVLSGGCFQNRLLTELIVSKLGQRSRSVGAPGVIPPNDGGLAAGQLAIAGARLESERQRGTL